MSVTDHQRVEWSSALRSNLEQLTDLHSIVQDRMDRMEDIETRLGEALETVERERTEDSDALSQLSTASEDAVRRARLVGVKLEMAFLEGEIPEEAYRSALAAAFPAGSQSVGATPALRHEALKRIVSAMSQFAAADPDGKLGTLAQEGATAIESAKPTMPSGTSQSVLNQRLPTRTHGGLASVWAMPPAHRSTTIGPLWCPWL